MAKHYLIDKSKVTAAMRTKAIKTVDAEYLHVATSDVEDFEAMLPEDEGYYMSSETVTGVEGEIASGILLPKKVVEG